VFKNGCDVERLAPSAVGVLRASGNYDVEPGVASIFHLDYLTLHTERKPEWPRTARALGELRDGFDAFRGVRVPVVGDEPTGFAEVPRGDSRSDNADDARYYAATAALMGAGSTFHSDDGIASRMLGPKQKTAAIAWFTAARWVPVSAQFAPYQRGSEFGGPGIGDMPLEHTDVLALRSFCKHADGSEWCVAIRPAPAWTAIPRRGCAVVAQPSRGLVQLACPN
jgi:hypothetical protein